MNAARFVTLTRGSARPPRRAIDVGRRPRSARAGRTLTAVETALPSTASLRCERAVRVHPVRLRDWSELPRARGEGSRRARHRAYAGAAHRGAAAALHPLMPFITEETGSARTARRVRGRDRHACSPTRPRPSSPLMRRPGARRPDSGGGAGVRQIRGEMNIAPGKRHSGAAEGRSAQDARSPRATAPGSSGSPGWRASRCCPRACRHRSRR